jgi:integrase
VKLWKEKDKDFNRWVWHADFTCAGKREHVKASTKEEREEIIEAIRRKARRRKFGLEVERARITLKQLVEERVKDLDEKNNNDRRCITVIRDFAERFPEYTVEQVTKVDLRNFVKARKLEFTLEREKRNVKLGQLDPVTIASTSINKELGYISAMLNKAPEMFNELADYRPPKFPWEKVSKKKRKRPITEDEDELLIQALRAPRQKWEAPSTVEARHDVADIFEVNLNTGMRGGETVRLKWPQVDWAGEQIYLGETKNGESRFVPMNSRVLEILHLRYESGKSIYIFPSPKGDRPRLNYSRTFRKVALRLGLSYGQRREEGFTMHSTRHTATTRMLRAGNDIATVQEIVGHSDRTMTLIYSHASDETKKRAIESLIKPSPAKKSEPDTRHKK